MSNPDFRFVDETQQTQDTYAYFKPIGIRKLRKQINTNEFKKNYFVIDTRKDQPLVVHYDYGSYVNQPEYQTAVSAVINHKKKKASKKNSKSGKKKAAVEFENYNKMTMVGCSTQQEPLNLMSNNRTMNSQYPKNMQNQQINFHPFSSTNNGFVIPQPMFCGNDMAYPQQYQHQQQLNSISPYNSEMSGSSFSSLGIEEDSTYQPKVSQPMHNGMMFNCQNETQSVEQLIHSVLGYPAMCSSAGITQQPQQMFSNVQEPQFTAITHSQPNITNIGPNLGPPMNMMDGILTDKQQTQTLQTIIQLTDQKDIATENLIVQGGANELEHWLSEFPTQEQ
ncbi:hypothetical protein ABK040_010135 [Willaertia magna]